MIDIFSKEKRSEIMSKIQGKNTRVELMFRKSLSAKVYSRGYRYRIHYKKIPGSPDVVFVKHGVAIFVDGDFWHGRRFKKLQSRLSKEYWVTKIKKNIARDRRVNQQLRKQGWMVLRFWESDLKKTEKIEAAIEKIILILKEK